MTYKDDCTSTTIQELPDLVSWCRPGIFRVLARIKSNISDATLRVPGFRSRPVINHDIVSGGASVERSFASAAVITHIVDSDIKNQNTFRVVANIYCGQEGDFTQWVVNSNPNNWMTVSGSNLHWASPGTTVTLERGRLWSLFDFSGEFDIQIDFNVIIDEKATSGHFSQILVRHRSNNQIRAGISRYASGLTRYQAWGINEAQYSYIATTDVIGKYRVRRNASNQFIVYYWQNGIWQWNGNSNGYTVPSADSPLDMFVELGFQDGSDLDGWEGNLYDFKVNYSEWSCNNFEFNINDVGINLIRNLNSDASLDFNLSDPAPRSERHLQADPAIIFDFAAANTGAVINAFAVAPSIVSSIIGDAQKYNSFAVTADITSATVSDSKVINDFDVSPTIQWDINNPDPVNSVVFASAPALDFVVECDGPNLDRFFSVSALVSWPITSDITKYPGHWFNCAPLIESNISGPALNQIRNFSSQADMTADMTSDITWMAGATYESPPNWLSGFSNRTAIKILPADVSADVTDRTLFIPISSDVGKDNTDLSQVLTDLSFPVPNNAGFFDDMGGGLLGDTFTGADGDRENSFLWQNTSNARPQINNNSLLCQVNSSNTTINLKSPYKLTGDFDIEVDFSNLSISSVTRGIFGFDIRSEDWTKFWRINRAYRTDYGSPFNCLEVFGLQGGTYSNYYHSGTYAVNDGSFRLTRSGTTFRAYVDVGGGWVLVGTSSGLYSWADDVHVEFYVDSAVSYPTISGNWDNFKINAGTVIWPENINYSYTEASFDDIGGLPGDTFTGTNGDAPSADLWTVLGSATTLINDNKLRTILPGGVGDNSSGVDGKYTFEGDFDYEVECNIVSGYPSSGGWAGILYARVDSDNQCWIFINGENKQIISKMELANNIVQADGPIVSSGFVKFRIKRVGSVWYSYYDAGSGWVQLQSRTSMSTSPVRPRLYTSNWTNYPGGTLDYDNFTINSGKIVWSEYPVTHFTNRKKIAVTAGDGITQCPSAIGFTDYYNEEFGVWAKMPEVLSTIENWLYFYWDVAANDNAYVSDLGSNINNGDEFTGADGDAPNSVLWKNIVGTPTILSNKLRLSTATNNEEIESLARISGDFDIQTDLILDTYPATDNWNFALRLWNEDETTGVTIERRYNSGTGGHSINTFDYAGSWVERDNDLTSITSLKLRHVRVGSSITSYYWNGSTWVSTYTSTAMGTADVKIRFKCAKWSSNPTAIADFDNFLINSADQILYYSDKTLVPDVNENDSADWLGTWKYRLPIAIDNEKVPSAKTDFPVYVPISASAGLTDDDVTAVFDELCVTTAIAGDDFTGTDGEDPNPTLWELLGPATHRKIYNNSLWCKCDNTQPLNEHAGVQSKFKLLGDFDIQLDYSFTTHPIGIGADAFYANFQVNFEDLDSNPPTSAQDRFYIRYGQTSGTRKYQWLAFESGSLTFNTDETGSVTSGKMRLVKIGNTFYAYRLSGTWVQIGSPYTYTSSPGTDGLCSIEISMQCNSDQPTAVCEFDNLIINSGTVIHPYLNRKKVAFASLNNIEFDAQVDHFDAFVEDATYHAVVPAINATQDTHFWMYFDREQPDNVLDVSEPINDSTVKLLLHGDESPLIDSASDRTLTLNNGLARTSDDYVFGGYSIHFNNSGYILVADSADWNLGSGDFTTDFRMRRLTTTGLGIIWEQFPVVTTTYQQLYVASNTITFYAQTPGVVLAHYTWNITSDTSAFHHYALVRSGTSLKLYQDGVALSPSITQAIGTNTLPDCAAALSIGARNDGTYALNAYIDEFRWVKGSAEWTQSFTPPLTAYSGLNLVGDDFTGTNGDAPNSILWDTLILGNGAAPVINSNKLRLDYPTSGVEGSTRVIGKFNIRDDFKIDVDWEIIRGHLSGISQGAAVLRVKSAVDSTDYAQVYINASNGRLYAIKLINSVAQDTSFVENTIGSGVFRVVREAGVWSTYYNVGGGFLKLGADISVSSDDVYIELVVESWSSNPAYGADFDNLNVIGSVVGDDDYEIVKYFPVTGWLQGWGSRVKTIVDANNVDADLTDIQIPIFLNASAGMSSKDLSIIFSVLGSNSRKLAISTEDGNFQCYAETEYWDNINSESVLWVKVPNISSILNTVLYLYFDPAQPDNISYVGPTLSSPSLVVWDDEHVLVEHMDGADQGSVIIDSASNKGATLYSEAGYPVFTEQVESNIIGRSRLRAKTNATRYGVINSSADFNFGSGDFTLRTWFWFEVDPVEEFNTIMWVGDGQDLGDVNVQFDYKDSDNTLRCVVYDNSGSDINSVSFVPVPTTWYLLTAVRESGFVKLFINDAQVGTDVACSRINPSTHSIYLGKRPEANDRFIDGAYDELRVLKGRAYNVAEVKIGYHSEIDNLLTIVR